MKILIPTAKEMNLAAESQPMGPLNSQTQLIVEQLAQLSVEDLSKLYKMGQSRAQVEKERLLAIQSGQAQAHSAWQLFDGLMYRQIERRDLSPQAWTYLEEHVFITSALYGMINVFTPISAHRLDFNSAFKVNGRGLKAYWRASFEEEVVADDLIISLLSSEFETVFSKPTQDRMIKLSFMEEDRTGRFKRHSTISKKARGKCLNQLIAYQIKDLAELKRLRFDGFSYRSLLSEEKHLVFVKRVQ